MRWFLAGLVLAVVGCGGTTMPPTFPVTGSVLDARGKAYGGGMVQFTSASDPTLLVTSVISGEGAYKLKTIKDRTESSGAPAGDYKVTLTPPFTSGQSGGQPVELPGTATVPAGGSTIELHEGKAPKSGP